MKGKVVILTGASSGIGSALALHFLAHGSQVVLAARNLPALQELAQAADPGAQRSLCLAMDVTRPEDGQALTQAALERFGRIDIVIANAGITMRGRFTDSSLATLHQVMDVNYWGAVHTLQPAVPHVVASRGSLVGISSIAGFRGLPTRAAYSSSKFALNGLLEVLAAELHPTGVHVLTACPGFTTTAIRQRALNEQGQTHGESYRDEQRMMTAEAVAAHIYRAIQRRRRMLVLTGQGRLTVWLNKWFTAWMDGVVYRHFQREAGNPLAQPPAHT